VDWNALIVGQLEFYWDVHLRPRLAGLTDDEYFWEPVAQAWNVRLGDEGRWAMDSVRPEPDPAPVTTIAWRMMHVAATGLYNRAGAFFGDDPFDGADMNDPRRIPKDLPGNASGAITFLEGAYSAWHNGIVSLTTEQMQQKLGPKGGRFAHDTMAALVIHINREVMHHGGEMCLLRDLYARRT
jgi:hypothetical protein